MFPGIQILNKKYCSNNFLLVLDVSFALLWNLKFWIKIRSLRYISLFSIMFLQSSNASSFMLNWACRCLGFFGCSLKKTIISIGNKINLESCKMRCFSIFSKSFICICEWKSDIRLIACIWIRQKLFVNFEPLVVVQENKYFILYLLDNFKQYSLVSVYFGTRFISYFVCSHWNSFSLSMARLSKMWWFSSKM